MRKYVHRDSIEYGCDQKRREQSVSGGDYTWYNWDIGWNVINEENSYYTLSMTYTLDNPGAQVAGILADASTTNPATGTYRYYSHDNLGSTRRLRASDKSSLGAYEYTPYGQTYATSGVALGSLAGAFTGKAWDDTSQLYYFPFRYYSPDAARWLTLDPLGMVDGPNVYAYAGDNPTSYVDLDGRLLGLLAVAAIWSTVCAKLAHHMAFKTFPTFGEPHDKYRHCFSKCYYNRCKLLTDPAGTLGLGVAWELITAAITTDQSWDAALADLSADFDGTVLSYGILCSCEDLCKRMNYKPSN